jgi:peptidoglycan/LPS O-acetylase OafA/YrhL
MKHSLPAMGKFDIYSVQKFVTSCMIALLPRFMIRGGLRQGRNQRHATSYLDALRGYAAFAVVNHHKFRYKITWSLRQPFLRLLWSGSGMVHLFFVISGYALSYQLLQLMRTRNSHKLLEKATSVLFRRYIRLYLSCAIASFISMIFVRLHLNHSSVHHYRTFYGQLCNWLFDTINFGSPFRDVKSYMDLSSGNLVNHYVSVMWTIPVEFRASMFIYFFCIATVRLSYRARTLLAWIIIALCFWWRETYPITFLLGLLIADSSMASNPEAHLPKSLLGADADTAPKVQSRTHRIFFTTIFVIALVVLGYLPLRKEYNHVVWSRLRSLVPMHLRGTPVAKNFWPTVGAGLLVWALESYPTLQTPLKWDFSQYLGDLSFGIYLMHMLVIFGLYDKYLMPLRKAYLGDSLWAYAPATIINWIAVLWAADLFSRIDKQVVLFARWSQNKLFTVKLSPT